MSPQFELIDSQCLCIFQLLDILHLLSVAPELLRDQDLHTPADNIVKTEYTHIKTLFIYIHVSNKNTYNILTSGFSEGKTEQNLLKMVESYGSVQYDSHCSLGHILQTKEGVINIRRTQDTRGKYNSKRVW